MWRLHPQGSETSNHWSMLLLFYFLSNNSSVFLFRVVGSSAFPFNALTVSYFSQSPTCTFIFQKYLCILLSRVFVVAARALLAVAVVPWPGIEPRSPAWGARSLNHWTPQGSPSSITILQLCHSFEIDSLPLFFFFKIVLSILGPLHLHRNFKVSFFIPAKKNPQNWDFNRNCIDSVNQFGQYCHVNVTFSDPWRVVSFI